MAFKPLVASVVGPADRAHWGQVLILPHAYGVVEIEDALGGAQNIGIDILTRLTNLLTHTPKTLEALEEIADQVYSPNCLTLLLLVPVDSVLYVVFKGAGAVYLKRGEQIATLLSSPGAISGTAKVHDTLLLVSKTIVLAMTKAQLVSVFDHLPIEESAEKLTLLLHEVKRGLGAAAMLFEVTDENKKPQDEPEKLVVKSNFRSSLARPFRRRLGAKIRSLKNMSRSKIILSVITASLFLIFLVSVAFGISRERSHAVSPKITSDIAQAQRTFDEGVALLDLNALKGREKLEASKEIIEQYRQTVSAKSKEGRAIATLYDQIVARLTMALHSVSGEPQLFYDVSLLKKNGLVSVLTLEGDNLVIGDANTQTIYKVGISAKNGAIMAGGGRYDNLYAITAHGDYAYVVTPNGIESINLVDKVVKLLIKKDPEWGTISSIVSFGGNLYLLDKEKSRIWKYISTESGYSDLHEYLNPDTLPNLSKSTNMAIDGAVWVGTSIGRIMKFSQGKEDGFVMAGISPNLGGNLLIYTNDNAKMLYILDSDNKRVVVLDKNGIYVAQYLWQGSIVPVSFVVSEENKKIILLFDGKLYALELS